MKINFLTNREGAKNAKEEEIDDFTSDLGSLYLSKTKIMTSENIEVVFSFDTTGSMYPCPNQISIKAFVLENGLAFKIGRRFYEFTKTETIQGHKEVILMDRATGDLFEGEAAREILELPVGATVRIKPSNLEKYVVFVQSTSANRKLIGETRFLYEVAD